MLDIGNYLTLSDIIAITQKYNINDISNHEKKVAFNSLELFDAISYKYHLESEHRSLLFCCSLLHDIGYFISKEDHQFHTFNLILKEPVFNVLPEKLRVILALVSANHGSTFIGSLELFSAEEKSEILYLTALLRVADALAHPHKHQINIKEIIMKNEYLLLYIKSIDTQATSKKVNKKSTLFTDMFNLEIIVYS